MYGNYHSFLDELDLDSLAYLSKKAGLRTCGSRFDV